MISNKNDLISLQLKPSVICGKLKLKQQFEVDFQKYDWVVEQLE